MGELGYQNGREALPTRGQAGGVQVIERYSNLPTAGGDQRIGTAPGDSRLVAEK